ncbi:MAG: GNAT family N-acetyltransferase [Planctomycetota bacterium]|nr:MAG: GNAT family N-acetyltransferase [Planctomycetota bacterium]REJ89154.1 MAG: GNAT family N-acetyltransferase [Planctomycetota bacterium]REK29750.1 MAG: GNAT family N-acetyltransferase [Planctomycetota bacterium]REK30429.1 MAG: GNAT family N-acetyltransferase [Planctomycetota bacterium]
MIASGVSANENLASGLKQEGRSGKLRRMLDVRTYAGDAATLSEFVGRVWRATYADRMPLPVWDERFFDWQLTWRTAEERPHCVAVYDGDRLVGTLLGEEFRFRWFDSEHLGTQGSWLTVEPEYRRQGVGKLLLEELKRRHRERGADFQIGYGYHGSRLSLGPKFWKTHPEGTVVPRSLGFSVRVLNPRAVAAWELSRLEGWGARGLEWWQPRPEKWQPDSHVREYRSEDLASCLELSHGLLDHVEVGIMWEQDRLAHQLDYKDYPQTLVYETDGQVAGFINYHRMEYLGRGTIRMAMIDLFAVGDLPLPAQVALMKTALSRMHKEGVDVAMLLRTPCFPGGVLWRTGFIPRLADQAILLTKMTPDFDPGRAKRFHVLWR